MAVPPSTMGLKKNISVENYVYLFTMQKLDEVGLKVGKKYALRSDGVNKIKNCVSKR